MRLAAGFPGPAGGCFSATQPQSGDGVLFLREREGEGREGRRDRKGEEKGYGLGMEVEG